MLKKERKEWGQPSDSKEGSQELHPRQPVTQTPYTNTYKPAIKPVDPGQDYLAIFVWSIFRDFIERTAGE